MKKSYLNPMADITVFELNNEDILTASGLDWSLEGEGDGEDY